MAHQYLLIIQTKKGSSLLIEQLPHPLFVSAINVSTYVDTLQCAGSP